jgi:transposase
VEEELAAENARLKRKLAEKEQEVAVLREASAYFAKNLT